MSHQIRHLVTWYVDAPLADKAVLLALADLTASDAAGCYASRETLCAMTGIRRPKTIPVITARLQADGWLLVQPGNGRGHATVYQLNIDRLLAEAEDNPHHFEPWLHAWAAKVKMAAKDPQERAFCKGPFAKGHYQGVKGAAGARKGGATGAPTCSDEHGWAGASKSAPARAATAGGVGAAACAAPRHDSLSPPTRLTEQQASLRARLLAEPDGQAHLDAMLADVAAAHAEGMAYTSVAHAKFKGRPDWWYGALSDAERSAPRGVTNGTR